MQDDRIICQCTKCGEVFDYGDRKRVVYGASYNFRYVCPKCGGTFTLIRPAKQDIKFLDRFVFDDFKLKKKKKEEQEEETEEDYSDGDFNEDYFF